MRPLVVLGLSGLVFAAVIVTTGAASRALAAAGPNSLANLWAVGAISAGLVLSIALADRLVIRRAAAPILVTIRFGSTGRGARTMRRRAS